MVGVPLGTLLGQSVGWRAAFLVVTGVFALAALAIAFTVPPHPGQPGRRLRDELRVFRIGQVWFALAAGAIGFGGFFAMYSYIAPMVTDLAGGPEWAVPVVLVVGGLGMTVGNVIGGALADRDLKKWMLLGLVALGVTSALLALTAAWLPTLVVLVFAVSFAGAALSPSIQTRLMDVAGDNQSIAAALNHSALNLGNSLGAFLGGVVIAAGLGFAAPAWVGALLAAAGLGIAAVSFRVERTRRVLTVA